MKSTRTTTAPAMAGTTESASRLFDVLTTEKGNAVCTPAEYLTDLNATMLDYAVQIMSASISNGEAVLQESLDCFELLRQTHNRLMEAYATIHEDTNNQ